MKSIEQTWLTVACLINVIFTAETAHAAPGGVQIPTHSDPEPGNNNRDLGPSFAMLRLEKGDPWVYMALWSIMSGRLATAMKGITTTA